MKSRPSILASLVVAVTHLSLLVEASALHDLGSKKAVNDYTPPSFSVAELQSGSRTKGLLNVLATTGILSVTGAAKEGTTLASLRQDALSGLCDCTAAPSNFVEHASGSDTALLADGVTRRITLATATVGSTPLSLQTEELREAGCSGPTIQAMESLRDQVAWVSHVFVQALDKVITNQVGEDREALLESLDGTAYMSLASIVKASHNLEHFHVYDKPSLTKETSPVLDVHTDAGLFLAFVPGMACDSTHPDEEANDFHVQTANDSLQRTVFPEGSVVIMLGAGAEHWLQSLSGPSTTLTLRATRHAVTMSAGLRRAWYGMMHTVPADAIVQDFPKRTFSDMRKAMALSGKNARTYGAAQTNGAPEDYLSIGCGSSPLMEATRHGATRINRRRMQMVSDASVCNNVTNFFCWMSCLEIPEVDKAVGYITEGYSLYCLDPGTLAKSQNKVSTAQEVCNENGVIGGAHQDSCLGMWQPTAPGVAYQEVSLTDPSLLAPQTDFCYGGTSMYMDGFHWTDPTCVIYLFPTWILKSAGSLTGACFGTIAFAVGLEAVIWKRRSSVPAFPVGWKRLGVSTLFYGVQLTMGYLLMLVVMIYSGPLFFSVIVGLMIGHALFNAGGVKAPKQRTSDDFVEGGPENEKDDCLERAKSKSLTAPEGLTPCCQNTV